MKDTLAILGLISAVFVWIALFFMAAIKISTFLLSISTFLLS